MEASALQVVEDLLGLVLEAQDHDVGARLHVGQEDALLTGPLDDRMPVRAGLRVTDRREHSLLEHGRHRVLEPLRLLVDLVPRDTEDVGQEALYQAMTADDGLRFAPATLREGERLVVRALDVAVPLQPADHLVDRRRGELHRAGDIRPVDLQAGLLEPEHRLQVLLLRDRGLQPSVDPTWRACSASRASAAAPRAGRPTPRSPSGSSGPHRRAAEAGACSGSPGRCARR